jgi:ATP-binding cassette subfamily F protein 3
MAKQAKSQQAASGNGKASESKKAEAKPAPAPAATKAPVSQDQKKELQRLQKEFSKAEKDVAQFQAEKARLEQEMGNPANYSDKNKFATLEQQYKAVQQKAAEATKQYEVLFEKVMELES